jgi:hypothetical protein
MTLAVPRLASTISQSSVTYEAAKAGGDGALLCAAGNLTRVAVAYVGGTAHRIASDARMTTTHGPLIAGKHLAYSTKDAA